LEILDKTTAILISITALIGSAATYFSNNVTAILTILGVIVGSTMTYKVQSKLQQRTWERERTLRNIDTIYNHLYDESIAIEQALDGLDDIHYYNDIPSTEWDKIENSHLHFMIEDRDFKKKLEDFYVLIKLLNQDRVGIWKIPDAILRKRILEVYGVNYNSILYTYDGGNTTSPNIFGCMMAKIHPKNRMIGSGEKIVLRIEYMDGNTVKNLDYNSAEDLQKFDDFWETLMIDVAKDQKLKDVHVQQLKIRTMNESIRQKLVEKIEQREKL